MQSKNTKIIVSASRRTDIPAFFSKWFIEHFRKGIYYPVNPFNFKKNKNPVRFDSNHISAIVFWTKYANPIKRYLPEIDDSGIPYYFLYTVTSYGKKVEPGIPSRDKRLEDFLTLSEKIGRKRVNLRYDPIFFGPEFTPDWHLRQLETILSALKGYSEKLIISFYTPYRKTIGRMSEFTGEPLKSKTDLNLSVISEFIKSVKKLAGENGVMVQSCAETLPLENYGISPGACIDGNLINELSASAPLSKDKGQRKECLCVKSVDIGVYNTCKGGCAYCYAIK